jgi:hypothetical protein
MSYGIGDHVHQDPRRYGLGAGQVPYLTDGSLISSEGRQSGRDVRDIAIGVEEIGISDEVRFPPRLGVGYFLF